MEQPRNREVKETIDILHEMATILNTGLDRDAVALCISLCERGANPEALAAIDYSKGSTGTPGKSETQQFIIIFFFFSFLFFGYFEKEKTNLSMKRKVEEGNSKENKATKKDHPFFDMKPKNAPTVKWINALSTVLIGRTKENETIKKKIAAFDLDGTLIRTKSGRTFPKDEHDWCWWNPIVPKRIEELHLAGYQIVVFSNQNGLNSPAKIKQFKTKIGSILDQLNSPVYFMAATAKDKYRKPVSGMWDWFIEQNSIEVDKDNCFYIGDAAGRNKKNTKDHSCADRKFAYNIQIRFQTPEEFFLQEPASPFDWWGFNAKEYSPDLPTLVPSYSPLTTPGSREVVICVGFPASGKSSFVKKHPVFKEYMYVNQDELKTKEKCLRACKQALEDSKSVVIDNTNPESSTRKLYIDMAKKANASLRCLYFGKNQDLAEHNNYYRAIHQSERNLISTIVFRTFKSKLQEPTLKEGFDEINHVNFVFDGNKNDYEEWKKWWI